MGRLPRRERSVRARLALHHHPHRSHPGGHTMKYQLKQIHCRPWLLVGLSLPLIESHYENNYGGAVRRLNAVTEQLAGLDPLKAPPALYNALKREELAALNSSLLHELYFACLGGDGQVNGE